MTANHLKNAIFTVALVGGVIGGLKLSQSRHYWWAGIMLAGILVAMILLQVAVDSYYDRRKTRH
jgi:uncharacterized membrane protein